MGLTQEHIYLRNNNGGIGDKAEIQCVRNRSRFTPKNPQTINNEKMIYSQEINKV